MYRLQRGARQVRFCEHVVIQRLVPPPPVLACARYSDVPSLHKTCEAERDLASEQVDERRLTDRRRAYDVHVAPATRLEHLIRLELAVLRNE